MKSTRRVVVIGAGMGGLAAAIDLARSGASVTLLERAEHPGGKVRALDVAGHRVDTGPTVFTMRWLFEDLFAAAGECLDEALELKPLDVLARHGWLDGSRLDLYADVERSADAIAAFAGPGEAEAYRRFSARCEAIFDTLDHTFMRREKPGPVALGLSLGVGGIPRLAATQPFLSLWRALGKSFRDPRLRQLFGRYATYCGSSPWAAPATLMLIAHAERAGVWAVGGGMPRLADALLHLAERQGVDVRLGTGAAEIDATGGAVQAVHTAEDERLEADAVVFNGDVAALGQGLLGPGVVDALPDRTAEPRSLSAVTWSLVGRCNGFPLHHHTVLFGDDYEDEFRAIFDRGEITATPTIYLCAQDREAGVAPAQSAERLFLLVNAPPKALSADALEAVEERLYELLGRHGLKLEVEAMQRTGPADWAQRFPGSSGAIYGWPTHGWRGSFRRSGSRSGVRGLYLAGGTVHPGPGIPMALQSGRIAARAVLEDA
ncbi:MAG: phytoene desaturase family protein [Xanthomonadales bacterium]|nr:phytoene desaturase family protein [Xanthomonadales bacterium]